MTPRMLNWILTWIKEHKFQLDKLMGSNWINYFRYLFSRYFYKREWGALKPETLIAVSKKISVSGVPPNRILRGATENEKFRSALRAEITI